MPACALSLVAAAATTSVWIHVVVVSVLAAVAKVVFEASPVGPPGPVLPIFVSAGMVFVPQTWGDLPLHLALVADSSAVAWCVVMARRCGAGTGPSVAPLP